MSRDQSRRSFLKGMAALGGAAAVGAHAQPAFASMFAAANPLNMPIGTQTYPIRALIKADHLAAFRTLGEAGFQRVELCAPMSYAADFGVLAKYTGAQLRQVLADQGLRTESSHIDMKQLQGDEAKKSLDWANDVGITQLILWSFNGPQNPTMDDLKRSADAANAIGEQTAARGVQLGVHNEGYEASMVDGQRAYDILMGLTHPQHVKYQFQVSSVRRGMEPAEYLAKYPGRFVSLHLQDLDPAAQGNLPIGQGKLDWVKIFNAAKIGGIKNYFVELSLEQAKASVPYLRSLSV